MNGAAARNTLGLLHPAGSALRYFTGLMGMISAVLSSRAGLYNHTSPGCAADRSRAALNHRIVCRPPEECLLS